VEDLSGEGEAGQEAEEAAGDDEVARAGNGVEEIYEKITLPDVNLQKVRKYDVITDINVVLRTWLVCGLPTNRNIVTKEGVLC
jgi:hypothetical protein